MFVMLSSPNLFETVLAVDLLAMHGLAASSLPRLSETEPKWFVFETSLHALAGRYCIESVAAQKKTGINSTFAKVVPFNVGLLIC